jgi:hypothetical protein
MKLESIVFPGIGIACGGMLGSVISQYLPFDNAEKISEYVFKLSMGVGITSVVLPVFAAIMYDFYDDFSCSKQ